MEYILKQLFGLLFLQLSTLSILFFGSLCLAASQANDANDQLQVTFSGYIKVDTIYDLAQKSGDRIVYSGIKTVPSENDLDNPQARMHARQSRVRMTVVDNSMDTPLKAVIETDFYGGGSYSSSSIEQISNSVAPRMRLAYLEYGHWLIGQDWSTFVDVASFPRDLNFANDTGQAFMRQGLIRYSYLWNGWTISHALENPESDLYQDAYSSSSNSPINEYDVLWDIVHRAKYQGKWGHVAFHGVLRRLDVAIMLDEQSSVQQSKQAYGISSTGLIALGKRQKLRFHMSLGEGIGRYIQETADAAGYLDPVTKQVKLLSSYGGYIGYEQGWSETLRSNFNLGFVKTDWPDQIRNDPSYQDASDSFHSLHTNLIWNIAPQFEVGIEYSFAQRTDLLERSGFVRRLQASVKYKF